MFLAKHFLYAFVDLSTTKEIKNTTYNRTVMTGHSIKQLLSYILLINVTIEVCSSEYINLNSTDKFIIERPRKFN